MKLVVHEFMMGDVDEPDMYAAQPLLEWQHTEAGKWVMQNSLKTPEWFRIADYQTFGYKYRIVAHLSDENATYYNLKWGNK